MVLNLVCFFATVITATVITSSAVTWIRRIQLPTCWWLLWRSVVLIESIAFTTRSWADVYQFSMAGLFWLSDLQVWDLGMENQQNQTSSRNQPASALPASVHPRHRWQTRAGLLTTELLATAFEQIKTSPQVRALPHGQWLCWGQSQEVKWVSSSHCML